MNLFGKKRKIIFLVLGFLMFFNTNLWTVSAQTHSITVTVVHEGMPLNGVDLQVFEISRALAGMPRNEGETRNDWYHRYAAEIEKNTADQTRWDQVTQILTTNKNGMVTFYLEDPDGTFAIVQMNEVEDYIVRPSVIPLPRWDYETLELITIHEVEPKVAHGLPDTSNSSDSDSSGELPSTQSPNRPKDSFENIVNQVRRRLPDTGEELGIWLIGLGVVIVSIVWMIWKKRSKDTKEIKE
jgi:LPXTG-motif cell wall-anchored protein